MRVPDPGFYFDPVEHLDPRGTVLGIHQNQQNVVEQLWLPQDDNYLKQRADKVWTSYHRLLGEVIILRADQEASLERATEPPALSALEVKKLKEQLEEALRAKDHAEVLAKAQPTINYQQVEGRLQQQAEDRRQPDIITIDDPPLPTEGATSMVKIADVWVSIEGVVELISGLKSSHRSSKEPIGMIGGGEEQALNQNLRLVKPTESREASDLFLIGLLTSTL
ncbi:uncharacterized protein A4U43_C08F22020 [Asparagus officinalis]|nr:uncharacterized protein A4U43_C08F22020 [Asparagus officinalis]